MVSRWKVNEWVHHISCLNSLPWMAVSIKLLIIKSNPVNFSLPWIFSLLIYNQYKKFKASNLFPHPEISKENNFLGNHLKKNAIEKNLVLQTQIELIFEKIKSSLIQAYFLIRPPLLHSQVVKLNYCK